MQKVVSYVTQRRRQRRLLPISLRLQSKSARPVGFVWEKPLVCLTLPRRHSLARILTVKRGKKESKHHRLTAIHCNVSIHPVLHRPMQFALFATLLRAISTVDLSRSRHQIFKTKQDCFRFNKIKFIICVIITDTDLGVYQRNNTILPSNTCGVFQFVQRILKYRCWNLLL